MQIKTYFFSMKFFIRFKHSNFFILFLYYFKCSNSTLRRCELRKKSVSNTFKFSISHLETYPTNLFLIHETNTLFFYELCINWNRSSWKKKRFHYTNIVLWYKCTYLYFFFFFTISSLYLFAMNVLCVHNLFFFTMSKIYWRIVVF